MKPEPITPLDVLRQIARTSYPKQRRRKDSRVLHRVIGLASSAVTFYETFEKKRKP
jgi:hypothetical protein